MSAFVLAELRARRRMIAGLAAGAFAYMLILALCYESVGVAGLGQAFEDGAPRAITAFGGSRDGDVLSPHGWMGLGFNHPMLMICALTAAIAIGAGSVAGEVESGRAQLLFSAPVARRRFVLAALAVWAVAEAAILTAAWAGALIGALVTPDLREAGVAGLAWAPVQLAPLTAFVAGVAFLASATAPTRGRALGVAVGVSVLAYLLSVVSGLSGSLDWLRWCSPFGFYEPGRAIDDGPRIWPILALGGAAIALMWAAARRTDRRDLV